MPGAGSCICKQPSQHVLPLCQEGSHFRILALCKGWVCDLFLVLLCDFTAIWTASLSAGPVIGCCTSNSSPYGHPVLFIKKKTGTTGGPRTTGTINQRKYIILGAIMRNHLIVLSKHVELEL